MKLTKTNVFEPSSKTVIGNKIYIVTRHFTDKRDLRKAVYETVKNETVRNA